VGRGGKRGGENVEFHHLLLSNNHCSVANCQRLCLFVCVGLCLFVCVSMCMCVSAAGQGPNDDILAARGVTDVTT